MREGVEKRQDCCDRRERTVRSVLNGPSVLFLSQPLWSEDILSERHGMRVISDAIAGM